MRQPIPSRTRITASSARSVKAWISIPLTRDRFWNLLAEESVVVYITGHTHSYSLIPIDGVWQLDVGHSMGARTQSTPSTFIMIHINGSQVSYETYRAGVDEIYTLRHSGYLRE